MTDPLREALQVQFEAWAVTANRVQMPVPTNVLSAWDAWQAAHALGRAEGYRAGVSDAAKVCVEWGDEKVAKWQNSDPDMAEDAKSRAWDGLQCAAAIRKLEP